MAFFLIQLLFLFSFCAVIDAHGYNDGTTWEFRSSTAFNDTPPLVDLPIILWWTRNLYPHISTEIVNCPNSKCYATNRRELLNHNQTRVVYFYGSEFETKELPLPRLPAHSWALAHEESPMNEFTLDHTVAMNLFNYTATYSRHSDFPLSLLSFPSQEFILNRPPVSTKDKNEYQKSKGYAPAVYVQSHCEVPSDRDRYIEELMKYITVDSYGKCVHNKDLPEDLTSPVENMFDDKFKDLLAEYKFILSFENGFCNDYMTEKLFRPLHVGGVPVYKGSPLARDFMPDNHSVIMVDDFESPRELAAFLHYLNENDQEYESYLEFKKRRTVTNPILQDMIERRPWPYTNTDKNYGQFFDGFECYICDKETERLRRERAHQKDPSVELIPPKITDGRKFACPAPEPYWKPEKLDWWFIYNYPEQYWTGLDNARAMRDMLLTNETDPRKFDDYVDMYRRRA